MKKAVLFLNGNPPTKEQIKKVSFQGATVFCTDGAYRYLSGIVLPHVVVSDFDSCHPDEIDPSCEIITFAAEKDYTDGFLAMKILAERGFDCVDIFGAYGGRPDMAESNYALLMLALQLGVHARFCGKMNAYLTNETFAATLRRGTTVSVVPFSDSLHIVYTKGLKYALTDYTMQKLDVARPNYIMGVSNVCVNETVEIGIDKGVALVFVEE